MSVMIACCSRVGVCGRVNLAILLSSRPKRVPLSDREALHAQTHCSIVTIHHHTRNGVTFCRCLVVNAAWWSWADALVSQHGVEGEESAPFKYAWPGIIATLSLILINMISKDDLQDIVDTGDDDVNVCGKVPCCKWKRLP